MTKFIEVSIINGRTEIINTSFIESVYVNNDTTTIVFSKEYSYEKATAKLKNSYEDIKKALL